MFRVCQAVTTNAGAEIVCAYKICIINVISKTIFNMNMHIDLVSYLIIKQNYDTTYQLFHIGQTIDRKRSVKLYYSCLYQDDPDFI